MPKQKAPDNPNLRNLESICRPSPSYVFPFTPRRYRQFAQEGIVPRAENGQIDIVEAARTYIGHLQAKIERSESSSYTDEKKRKTRLEADRKEIELAKLRGELIQTAVAQKLWGAVCYQIRAKMLALPTKVAPLVAALRSIPEIKDRLEKSVYEVLIEITNPDLEQIARMGLDLSDPGDHETAAKKNGLGMGGRKKVSKRGK